MTQINQWTFVFLSMGKHLNVKNTTRLGIDEATSIAAGRLKILASWRLTYTIFEVSHDTNLPMHVCLSVIGNYDDTIQESSKTSSLDRSLN